MRNTICLSIFGILIVALTITVCAGIWTGDDRWFATAWIPGSLAGINLCAMPLILGWDAA